MSNDARPEIRFPGFTDDWEQRKLGEVADIIGGGTPNTNNPEYWNGDIDWYAPAEIGKQIYVKNSQKKISQLGLQKSSAKILPIGTVLFTSRAGIGNTAILAKEGTTNQGFQSIVPHENKLDSYFIFSRTHELKRYGEVTGAGSTFAEVSGKQMAKMPILIPYIDEQQKIGIFFKKLDDTITLHQRKLDLLKETKKGFLQKMFPKNGAKVPEIRFPGFTEDWEERKFGEIVQVSRGLTYKPSDVQIEGIRVLRSSNINEDVFVLRDDDVFVKPDAVNIAPIKNGDILITSANGSSRLVGKHAIVNGLQDKTVHGGFMLRVKSKNTWFTNSLMSSRWYNYFINIYVSGGNGAIGNLRKYDLESQTIIVPDDEEQQKIGAFFKQLDDTIALHQRKLDLLKETKKGFLQKMFV
ncbi:restriction endonuclease subunit S [Enterococcus faecium]|uniref:restriction endonuclease subunit S n=1 Tax=Enterococcus faecium TaxID=1352 RepID=UPI000CF333A5|nr:restriction endonuclease subunit S [Enterococcus faecium]EME5452953.1 restriction endonuclease subunit S [Enterococcus faecium]EMF0326419.1 restriction endonuclease subunit S [Enterococcus faecium]PQH03723.1 restriction endonuclease subunit S [Enterococcus faecium]ROY54906.1 restriction endonuclease subunit S [Enterococcus faecium]ROY99887.1 restriction endonuclease subunit S [Enterococcus faecium]